MDGTLPKLVASAALGVYVEQAILVPNRTANLARAYAERVGGGLLSFCPPPGVHLKSVFIKNCVGDVNLHHSAKPGQMGVRGTTVYGNPYRLPFRDGAFAALFSYGTLERLDRPDLAILEWQRVARRVFVVVPQIWMPEAWFNTWHISPDLRQAWPLWTRQNRVIWLPPPRRRGYDAGTCPTPSPQTLSQNPTRRPMGHPTRQDIDPEPPGPASNASAADPSLPPVVRLLQQVTQAQPEEPDYTPTEESSDSQSSDSAPYIPPGSPSSTSVSSMMIVSGPDPESD